MNAEELLKAIVEYGFYSEKVDHDYEDSWSTPCCFYCEGLEEENEEYRKASERNNRRANKEPPPSLRDLFDKIYGAKTPLTDNQRRYAMRKHKEAMTDWANKIGLEPLPEYTLEIHHKPDCLWLQAKELVS